MQNDVLMMEILRFSPDLWTRLRLRWWSLDATNITQTFADNFVHTFVFVHSIFHVLHCPIQTSSQPVRQPASQQTNKQNADKSNNSHLANGKTYSHEYNLRSLGHNSDTAPICTSACINVFDFFHYYYCDYCCAPCITLRHSVHSWWGCEKKDAHL